jgi:hypothetical protein
MDTELVVDGHDLANVGPARPGPRLLVGLSAFFALLACGRTGLPVGWPAPGLWGAEPGKKAREGPAQPGVVLTPARTRCSGQTGPQVTLLGKVVVVSERSGNLDLRIDDGTGTMEATVFLENPDDVREGGAPRRPFRAPVRSGAVEPLCGQLITRPPSPLRTWASLGPTVRAARLRPRAQPNAVAQKMAELRPGTYVRVYGAVKGYDGRWSINAFAVRVVHDYNEVRGDGTGGGGNWQAGAQQRGQGVEGDRQRQMRGGGHRGRAALLGCASSGLQFQAGCQLPAQ